MSVAASSDPERMGRRLRISSRSKISPCGFGPARFESLDRFRTANMPASNAPLMSSGGRSPTKTACCGLTPTRSRVSRKIDGCGLAKSFDYEKVQ